MSIWVLCLPLEIFRRDYRDATGSTDLAQMNVEATWGRCNKLVFIE
jgi:hypothetical protein